MNNSLNKCPACGALRQAMATECTECGYQFTKSGTTVLIELSAKLDDWGRNSGHLLKKRHEAQLVEIINSFHIPHVKEELLDVMYFIQPKALEPTSTVSKAWRARQREVFERVKQACVHDKVNMNTILAYEAEINKLDKQHIRNIWRTTPGYIKWPLVIIFVAVLLMLIPAKDTSPKAYAERFSKAVTEARWDKAIEYLLACPDMGTTISSEYIQLIRGLLEQDRIADAEVLFTNRSAFVSADNYNVEDVQQALMRKFIANDKMSEALEYAYDIDDIEEVMAACIERNDEQTAMKIYRRHSSKFTKWDSEQQCNVYCGTNPNVQKFLNQHGIKTK